MKKRVLNILKFLVFISLGIFIFWKVYKGQDIDELIKSIHQVDFFWIYVSIVLGILSHVARSARWVLLAKGLGYKPSGYNSFFAVMIAYLANLAFPRMGEVTRCAVIKQYEKVPLSTAIGTIITERVIDVVMLLSVTFIAVLSQFNVFQKFITDNPAISKSIQKVFDSGILIGVVAFIGIVFLILYMVFHKKLNQFSFFKRINEKIYTLKDGVLSVKNVKRKWLFVLYTIAIWVFYYLMLYVCFFSFPFMKDFGALVALTLFVLGSYGMVAPVQGGIGAYHFMVIAGLVIYGVADGDARLFALIVWSAQTIMIIGVGFISYLLLPIYNRYKIKTQ